jgi:hypothetical protein
VDYPHPDRRMEPNIILKYNLEREKKLKELRENPKENASEISKLLTQLVPKLINNFLRR